MLINNLLFGGLPEIDECWRTQVRSIVVPAGHQIYARGDGIDRVFLVDAGIAALAWPDKRNGVDIALIGHEGMVGTGITFGGPVAVFPAVARSPVTLLEITAMAFDEAVTRSPVLKARVFDFATSLVSQIAEAAYANARFSVERRIARWLTLAYERISTPDIDITHDELALAVGCRRAGATVAIHCLEGERLIRSTRGRVTVLNLGGLARVASGHPVSEATLIA